MDNPQPGLCLPEGAPSDVALAEVLLAGRLLYQLVNLVSHGEHLLDVKVPEKWKDGVRREEERKGARSGTRR